MCCALVSTVYSTLIGKLGFAKFIHGVFDRCVNIKSRDIPASLTRVFQLYDPVNPSSFYNGFSTRSALRTTDF